MRRPITGEGSGALERQVHELNAGVLPEVSGSQTPASSISQMLRLVLFFLQTRQFCARQGRNGISTRSHKNRWSSAPRSMLGACARVTQALLDQSLSQLAQCYPGKRGAGFEGAVKLFRNFDRRADTGILVRLC